MYQEDTIQLGNLLKLTNTSQKYWLMHLIVMLGEQHFSSVHS